ncbi:MAG: FAD-binding oxidoreductase [Anaerolinea sp.]|nr:FAD-binding oxidoreductase [Anaerolinea sp.]
MVSDHKSAAPVRLSPLDLGAKLRAAVTGRVITPADADYDAARAVFYGGIDRHPAAVVRVANATDAARVVSFARDHGVELAIRSGGHSGVGHSTTDGGIVLDLSAMKAFDIDLTARTAWAEAGLTAGEVTTTAAAHGLAIGFGDTGSVGIGGITVGGGVGYLVRKYGLTIDNLLAAEVVTADGEILHVDDHTYPDLFWAIRGGGGNFGVVTRFQFQLHPLATVYGGELVLPATPETLRAFVAAADAAPEELSSIANVMPAPPMPFLPAEVHGKLIIFATLVYAGDAAAGEQALAPFRAIATPLADMLRPMAYPEVYPPDDPDYHPVAASRTLFIDRLDQSAADLMFDYLKQRVAPFSVVQVRALGGAYARVPVDATAYAHRDRRIMVNVAALYDQPDLAAPAEAWVDKFAAALQQGDGTVGAYVNFLSGDGTARIREAYPGATWERLRAIKAHYDPTNLFHLNHNIPPAE